MKKETIIRENFKRMFRLLLNDSNLKVSDFARNTNLSSQTVYSWTNGNNFPSAENLEVIAAYFNITPSDLININGNSFYNFNQEDLPNDNLNLSNATPIPMENIVFDDYFPLYYSENLSAGTFMELLEQEPENVVHVPIRFQSKKKRLHAFKVNGESMNNILIDGTVVVAEDTYNNSIKIRDNSIVVAFYNGEATIKRFFELEDHILLAPDSKNKSFMPIKINKEEEFTILGRVIWFSNPEDIMEKLGEI